MDVRGIGWAGVRTERFAEMRALLTRIVGDPRVDEDGFAVWRLPNGDAVELFGADDPEHRHFSTGPVVGFQVDDVDAARAELEAAGVEFRGETIDTGVCHMAFCSDFDGNGVILHRRYAPARPHGMSHAEGRHPGDSGG